LKYTDVNNSLFLDMNTRICSLTLCTCVVSSIKCQPVYYYFRFIFVIYCY